MPLLYCGDRTQLQGKEWYCLELAADSHGLVCISLILKRIGKALPTLGQPTEMFVPIDLSNQDNNLKLLTHNMVFARSVSLTALSKLKRVVGVTGFCSAAESGDWRHAIPVEDDFVQQMMQHEQAARAERAAKIHVGSFVRIIDGVVRDCCGYVTIHDGTRCVVQVRMLTRCILVECPTANLLSLDFVPADRRVWYYSPPVANLGEHHPTLTGLRRYFGSLTATNQRIWDTLSPEARERHSQKVASAQKRKWDTASPQQRSVILAQLRRGREIHQQATPKPSKPGPKEKSVARTVSARRAALARWENLSPEAKAERVKALTAARKAHWQECSQEERNRIADAVRKGIAAKVARAANQEIPIATGDLALV